MVAALADERTQAVGEPGHHPALTSRLEQGQSEAERDHREGRNQARPDGRNSRPGVTTWGVVNAEGESAALSLPCATVSPLLASATAARASVRRSDNWLYWGGRRPGD